MVVPEGFESQAIFVNKRSHGRIDMFTFSEDRSVPLSFRLWFWIQGFSCQAKTSYPFDGCKKMIKKRQNSYVTLFLL